ncbi:hypothetical protein PpBr36_07984 [Pyricularia pennisetigena]|uniref:hypothetical protein n=1 Tax=Pyricularia pennisetigena TaxID=1578925 RepID=UPI00115000A4
MLGSSFMLCVPKKPSTWVECRAVQRFGLFKKGEGTWPDAVRKYVQYSTYKLGLPTKLDILLLMFHSHGWTLGQLALNYFLHLYIG